MRVLLVGDYPPPHGGVAVHVSQLHAFLRERGVPVRVLDIGKGGETKGPDVVPARPGPQLLGALGRAFLDGHPASGGWCVHLHTSGNNPRSWMVAAAVGAPGPRAPRFITLHSGLLPDYLAASAARRVLARTALAAYTRVVAVSPAVRDALVAAGVPAAKVVVQPAFLASQVRPGEPPAGLEAARARRSPLLVMAHHPSPVYGRALALRALKRVLSTHPGAGLAVFGPGTRDAAFAHDARLAGVAGQIEDFGELSHGAALALIARGDLFLRPTTHDGDSISVREALALGVPCVASDVCARPDGVRTFRAGDADALADAVRGALSAGPAAVAMPDAGPALLALYEDAARRGLTLQPAT